jgi:NAD+ synthase (glutamine-hydrolysing)
MRTLRIAVGEMPAHLGDVSGNMREACRLSVDAAHQGARLIVLPEGCLTGNARASAGRQSSLPAEPAALQPLIEVATSHGITICAGFATPLGEGFNMVQAAVCPTGAVLLQRKAFRAKAEPDFLLAWPDSTRVLFDVDGVRTIMVICSEYASPTVRASIASLKPDLILHPSAGCMQQGELQVGRAPVSSEAQGFAAQCRRVVDLAAQDVRMARVAKVGANPLGFDGETWWPGNSFGLDATGAIRLWLPGENCPERMASRIRVADLPFPEEQGAIP